MHCFICGLDFNIGFSDGLLLHSENIINYDNSLVTLLDIFRKIIIKQQNSNLSVNDSTMICTMCIVLLKQFHKYQVKLKTIQHLLLKSTYRTNRVNKIFPEYEYERMAWNNFTENKYGSYSCNQCFYRTSYSDTIAPHFLYHKKWKKFEAGKLNDQQTTAENHLIDTESIEEDIIPEQTSLVNSKSTVDTICEIKEEFLHIDSSDYSVEYLSTDCDADEEKLSTNNDFQVQQPEYVDDEEEVLDDNHQSTASLTVHQCLVNVFDSIFKNYNFF